MKWYEKDFTNWERGMLKLVAWFYTAMLFVVYPILFILALIGD